MIPFNLLFKGKYTRFFYLLKWTRLIKASILFNADTFIIDSINMFYNKKFQKVLQDEELKFDQSMDHNKINSKILLKYVLNTLKMLIILILLVYMVAILYFIWIDVTKEFAVDGMKNGINQMETSEAVLVMIYWSMTTLSTIGLGDYYPVSNYERALMCFVFLMGVAFFTYCFNVLQEILVFLINFDTP